MTGLAHTRRITPVVVIFALTIRVAAQIIPTDGAPPGPRTGMIVGQVVDASTGAPVGEAIVSLTMPKYLESLPATPKGRVMADRISTGLIQAARGRWRRRSPCRTYMR